MGAMRVVEQAMCMYVYVGVYTYMCMGAMRVVEQGTLAILGMRVVEQEIFASSSIEQERY